MAQFWQEVKTSLQENLPKIAAAIAVVAILLILFQLLMKAFSRQADSIMKRADRIEDQTVKKRVISTMTFTKSLMRYVMIFLLICLILNVLGYDATVSNLLITAGVGTLIVSVGVQSVIKDIACGIFIMLEQQIAVGDRVVINGHEGTISSLALRDVYLTSLSGTRVIIPYGQITSLEIIREGSRLATVMIPTPLNADSAAVMVILDHAAQQYYNEHRGEFSAPPRMTGITGFTATAAQITLTAVVRGASAVSVEAGLRLALKQALQDRQIPLA